MEKILKICVLLWLMLTWPTDAQGDDADYQTRRLAKSSTIRSLMKPQVKACDDFYAYSCGNFAESYHANDELPKRLIDILLESYDRKVTKFLNQNDRPLFTKELEGKVKRFYHSCQKRHYIKEKRRQYLLQIMEDFGGMPALKGADWDDKSFDWLKVVAEILRKYGKPIIIGAVIEPDFNDPAINRLYIGQVFGMPPATMDYYYKSFINSWKWQLEVVFGMSPPESLKTARDMVDFAQKLSLGVSDHFKWTGLQGKCELSLLSVMDEKYGPTLNFTYFVKTWLGHDYPLPVYEYVEGYIQNLRKLIPETPAATVANYIMWMLIQDFEFDVEVNEAEDQGRICRDLTQKYFFKYIDNKMYKDLEKFQPKIINDTLSLFQHLKETFAHILKSPSSRWMTEFMRAMALEKLSTMTLEVNGYTNTNFTQQMGSLAMYSGRYFENMENLFKHRAEQFRMKLNRPTGVENSEGTLSSLSYLRDYNLILMPMYMFEPPPMWEDGYPKALHYGSVGSLIAHVMASAIRDISRNYNAKGQLNNLWDPISSGIFETRKKCVNQQYNIFKHGGNQTFPTEISKQDDTISDISGLRIAYQAYDNWLSGHHQNQTLEQLPQMDLITGRQLFFIAAAQNWCTTTDTYFDEIEVRVKGMVSNSEAFAEAFQCDVGSAMNPQNKCVIY